VTRYYIRVVLVIVLVMIASAIVLNRFASTVTEKYIKPRAIIEMSALADRLEKELGGKPLELARDELELLESRLNFTARIVPIDDLPSSIASAPGAAAGNAGRGASAHAADADAKSESVSELETALPLPADAREGVEDQRFYAKIGNAPFVVEIAPEKGLSKRLQREEGAYGLMGLGVVMLLVIGGGYFLVSPLVKKLRKQEDTIGRLADGDFSARVPDSSSRDAIGRLGTRINEMADRIQELLANQRQLLQAVSHELRTPTSRIGFSLEMLADAKTDEERRRRIDSLGEDLNDLDNLLDELLTFLRFDQGTHELAPEPCDLEAMLNGIIRRVSRHRPEITIELASANPQHPQNPCVAPVSRKFFPRAVENLLMNAIRYANAKIVVRCARNARSRAIVIEVEDDGPGIPAEDRERIFEPFTRVDSSRDRRSGGAGLGLAIARRIVVRHQGSISASASSTGGALFRIELPLL